MTKLKDYHELDVWQVAMDLTVEAYKLAARLPASESYGLAAQIRKSAVSIPSNIAEGYGRNGRPEYRQFVGYSIGSLKELETQAILTVRLNLVEADGNADVLFLGDRVGRMLTRLRQSLS